MIKKKNNMPIVYLLSFLFPVIIAFLAYYNIQVYPGSVNTMLIYDMRNELLPTYGYLSNPGPGYDSLFYSMSGALGYCFMGRVAHVLSLFDIVYKFVPITSIPDTIYYLTLFKFGLCGLCMSIFLSSRHHKDIGDIYTIFLSSCYALMSYMFIFSLWPLWIDLVMLFPLLALSIEKLIAGEKNISFILLLSLGMISDYHITYMAIIALTLYFYFRLVEEGLNLVEMIHRSVLYLIHGIISAGLSSFLLFPVVNDLMIGKLSEYKKVSKLVFVKNTPFDIMTSFFPGSYSALYNNASPNIFCGSVVFIFTLIWFFYGRKEIRERIAGAVVFFIYIVSFIFGPLDRIWHGFRDPVGFSVRYSFTFVFFMICFAVRGYRNIHRKSFGISTSIRITISVVLILFSMMELFFNGSYILAKLSVDYRYTNRNEYFRFSDFMTELTGIADYNSDGEYYRIYKDFHFTLYDGALYGYDGLLILESNLNPVFVSFLNNIGIGASSERMDECGITPPTASLMCFRYFISTSSQSNFYELIGESNFHYLYKNAYALPLIFGTSFNPQDELKKFSDDPFENVNIIFSDFLGERNDVFVRQNCNYYYPEVEKYKSEYTTGIIDLIFTPDKEGSYWIYSVFNETNNNVLNEIDEYGSFVAPLYADVCLNDVKIGSFRDSNYSYCNEIGILKSNEEVKVSVETSYSELGNTYIYRYDEAALEKATEYLSERGFGITYIGDKGIVAEGNMQEDGYVYISLPYNSGYNVYVDGKKTEYTSYRDVFLLVKMKAGNHKITIKYIPRGFISGVIVSLIFLSIMIIYMRINPKRAIMKKSVKHP